MSCHPSGSFGPCGSSAPFPVPDPGHGKAASGPERAGLEPPERPELSRALRTETPRPVVASRGEEGREAAFLASYRSGEGALASPGAHSHLTTLLGTGLFRTRGESVCVGDRVKVCVQECRSRVGASSRKDPLCHRTQPSSGGGCSSSWGLLVLHISSGLAGGPSGQAKAHPRDLVVQCWHLGRR